MIVDVFLRVSYMEFFFKEDEVFLFEVNVIISILLVSFVKLEEI